ncbi:condensation domain-containing protein, partial [Microcoleus sp. Aus8_D3]
NGKLDKRALPDAEFTSAADYVEARTETEEKICKIWSEVLGLERVGVTDDFFRIGGDSILSIQVSNRMRQAGFPCQVKDIFLCKTVEKLSNHLGDPQLALSIKSEQGILEGSFGLLPIQQWFVDRVESGEFLNPSHWNQSFLIRVPPLDQGKLQGVIEELAYYHDALRLRYIKGFPAGTGSKDWQQEYQKVISIPTVKSADVSRYSPEELHAILTDWQSGFVLEDGLLFQVGYLYGYGDGSARLYLALHHMIVDGVSWRILTEDIKTLYEGKTLGSKGSSYRQWIECVKDYSSNNKEEGKYWATQLLGISRDLEKDAVEEESSSSILELDNELTSLLLHKIPEAYHTEINDLLLTGFAYALKDITGSAVQGITLEGHGRELIDPSLDHSHTVGWFTSMFPVRLELSESVKESIRGIKESLRKIPNRGVGFGSFAVTNGSGYSHKDLPRISFNYLGQFDSSHDGHWQIVSEGSGASMHSSNQDHQLVNINGLVSNGKLWFTIVTRLGSDRTVQLRDSLKDHLINIIRHCQDKLEQEGGSYTPSDFNGIGVSQVLLDDLQSQAYLEGNELSHIYPANSLQQGFIYHSLSQLEDDAYRVQVLFDYHEHLDTELYIKAWEFCIAEYPILRTGFNWQEELIQVIYKSGKLFCQVHDISELLNQDERDAAIEVIQQEDRRRDFDLSKPTQLRLHIIKQAPGYYTVLKSEHHIISDGWSGPILLRRVHENYQRLIAGAEVRIKEDTAYLAAQQYISANRNGILDYWREVLSEVESANDINALLSRSIDTSSYKRVEEARVEALTIDGELYKGLKRLSQREGVTVNVITQFMWHKLIEVYSGSKRTVVGTTVSGRDLPIEGIEESVGLYINTLPLVIDWNNGNTVRTQLHRIQEEITRLSAHSFANLAKLQKGGDRLFQSLFVFENYPLPKSGTGKEVIRLSVRNSIEKIDYPLGIIAYEHNNSLTIKLQYDGKYLTKELASTHLARLESIVSQVVKNPQGLHRDISLLLPSEYKQIVYDWNATDKDYPSEKTLQELFAEQVLRTPDKVALVYEDNYLSYRDLDEKSNQLARHIRRRYNEQTGQELVTDTLIALCLDRSLEMVIGILGVLKAGGAYVPIDPAYPQERIDYILEDTQSSLILSHSQLLTSFDKTLPAQKVIDIDLNGSLYKEESKKDMDNTGQSTDLAYVIYTSGTTGRPKGVMVEHRSVSSLVFNNYIEVVDKDVFGFLSSPVFDATTFEIWTPLLQGNRLAIPADHQKTISDIEEFRSFLMKYNISILWLTKTLFESLYRLDEKIFSGLNYLIIGGEALDKETVTTLISSEEKPRQLLNGYGPTESTTFTCTYDLNSEIKSNNVPIGVPIDNRSVYVLDSGGQPVPVGVIGELYIGGAGV